MIITIFGATGKVGKQIVKTFLNEGHTVRLMAVMFLQQLLGKIKV